MSDSSWNAGPAHAGAPSLGRSSGAAGRPSERTATAVHPAEADADGDTVPPMTGGPSTLGARRHGTFHGPQLSITDVSARVNAGSSAEPGGLTPDLSASYPPAGQFSQQQQQLLLHHHSYQHLQPGGFSAPPSRKNSDEARWDVPPSVPPRAGPRHKQSRLRTGVTVLACLLAGWFMVGRMCVWCVAVVDVAHADAFTLSNLVRGSVVFGEASRTIDVTPYTNRDGCSST